MNYFISFAWTAQQCIRVDPNFAEAYSNLANALKELGDVMGAIQFYLKVCVFLFVLFFCAFSFDEARKLCRCFCGFC